MFQKPFRVKSQTAIKGSDRKRLRLEFSNRYIGISDEVLKALVPNKDDMTVSKIVTHAGANVAVYNVGRNPMLFEVGTDLYPTVYALWSHPSLVSLTFTTWPSVLPILQGGADLMLPGVKLPGSTNTSELPLGVFVKGQGCGVNLANCRSCVAVGKTAVSSDEMRETGMIGKGVIVLHTYRDHLWATGSKSEPPMTDTSYSSTESDDEDNPMVDTQSCGTCQLDPVLVSAVDGCYIANSSESAQLNNVQHENVQHGIVQHDNVLQENVQHENVQHENVQHENVQHENVQHENVQHENVQHATADGTVLDDLRIEVSADVNGSDVTCSPQEDIDDLLQTCFLHSLKLYGKKAELPVLTSTFFRNNIMPCCPSGKSLDVKKSSYKKLGKFLAVKQSEGLVKVKELSKGVESLVEIDFDHDQLRAFKVPSLDVPGDPQPGSEVRGATGGMAYTPPQIKDVYIVTVPVLPLLEPVGKRKGDSMSAAAVRETVVDYVKINSLQQNHNRGLVRIDTVLASVALNVHEYAEDMRWEELTERILSKMTRAYEITTQGSTEVRKGEPEKIRLEVVQRGSNKKVTLVHNLEVYGIEPTEFAALVQKGVACSTSVTDDETVKKNKEYRQVCAQGNQINFIASLLSDKYQLPQKYISGLEKAPKKKKR